MAGDNAQESLQQPRFDRDDRLCCLTDRQGFWQPWIESGNGLRALPCAAADHAPAPWQLGGCTWLPLGEETWLASWTEAGFGRLGLHQADGSHDDFTGDYSRFRSLAVDAHHIYCIAASPISPSAVIAIDRETHQVQVLAGGVAPYRHTASVGRKHCATPVAMARPMVSSIRP